MDRAGKGVEYPKGTLCPLGCSLVARNGKVPGILGNGQSHVPGLGKNFTEEYFVMQSQVL